MSDRVEIVVKIVVRQSNPLSMKKSHLNVDYSQVSQGQILMENCSPENKWECIENLSAQQRNGKPCAY